MSQETQWRKLGPETENKGSDTSPHLSLIVKMEDLSQSFSLPPVSTFIYLVSQNSSINVSRTSMGNAMGLLSHLSVDDKKWQNFVSSIHFNSFLFFIFLKYWLYWACWQLGELQRNCDGTHLCRAKSAKWNTSSGSN